MIFQTRNFRLSAALLAVLLLAAVAFPAGSQPPAENIRLTFTGDIMMHNSQLRRAWLGTDEEGNDRGYDFHPSFALISHCFRNSSLVTGNLETTFGGPDSAWITNSEWEFREYQAFPCFTCPDSLAEALKAAGFQLLGTANNHCMDSRLAGAARTLDILGNADMETTGTSREGSPRPWRGTISGYRISLMAWTQSVNGLVAPKGMEKINVFSPRGNDSRLKEMLAEIRREKALSPDILILFIHWGQEYMEEPDQYQKNLADLAIEAGADIIIGSHPHTLQPVERRSINSPEGPGQAFIAWSLGNFISSQRYVEGKREWVDGSAILNLDIGRDNAGRACVRAVEMIPIYVLWSGESIRVITVKDGLEAARQKKWGLSSYDVQRLQAYDEWVPRQLTRYLGKLPARQNGAAWRVEFPDEE